MLDQINGFFHEILSDPTAIMGYFWLIAALVLLMLEMTTPGLFFFVAFACGAICAAIAAVFGLSLPWQMWISVFGGVVCFFILKHLFLSKKIARKELFNKS
jgi:membrane protein implicated in regulation of membrane protease activity